MMNMIHMLQLALWIALLSNTSQSTGARNGIRPLHSTRVDAERVLGVPTEPCTTKMLLGPGGTLTLAAIEAPAKGWRGIAPLKSTRADVERLLGLPGKHGRYQFDNERAYIEYRGTDPCARENACLCTVPKDTVLSIYVELEVEMRFSTLKLDKKKYKKFVSPQDRTVATYSNEKDGIIYTVSEEHDEINAIEYLPTVKDCEQALKRRNRTAKRPAISRAASPPQSQHIDWCKIIPFQTTRTELETMLGAPVMGTDYVLTYDTADDRITVWYGGVKARPKSSCKWVLPDDVVLSFVYTPKNKFLVTKLSLDLKKFKKEKARERDSDYYYYNPALGLTLSTRVIDGEEVLLSLERDPNQVLREKYCKEP